MKTGFMVASGLAAAAFAFGVADADAATRSTKAKPEGPVAAQRCNAKKCAVAVSVSDCVITVKPEVLIVGSMTRGVEITWEIPAASKYTFAPNGIAIKPTERDISRQFRVRKMEDARKFVLTDDNTESGIVFYSVTVLDSNRTACPTLDPPIINEY